MADAEAIAFLQKQVTADGSSLYGHLTRVLAKVSMHATATCYVALLQLVVKHKRESMALTKPLHTAGAWRQAQ